MTRARDLMGLRFGRLVVVERAETKARAPFWRCLCDCGVVVARKAGSLVGGETRSCGCLQRALTIAANRARSTHGHTPDTGDSPEYRAWAAAKSRCSNPRDRKYPHYGGRGITVCDRWRDSFENFLADMGPRPSPLHSIDRIDNDRGYEPGNCRWATSTEQNNNRRNVRRRIA